MEIQYDVQHVARMFDGYGDEEWERHEKAPFTRVAFHLHRHYLSNFIRPGDRVLDAGAGAGRFTLELARLGAHITVTDVSAGQLELNRQHLGDAGLEEWVEARVLADILDLSRFKDRSFDAVVCYGGPLSYVLDHADRALAELLRVMRPGGPMLLSVMSNYGSLRAFLPSLHDEISERGAHAMQTIFQRIFETGDLPQQQSSTAPMHMFTWAELRGLLERQPCEILAASAANFLSVRNNETCQAWSRDPDIWKRFLEWEIQVCAQPGAIDGGTHIIAVIRAR